MEIEHLGHLDNRSSKKGHGQILTSIYDVLTNLSMEAMVFVREKGFSRFPHETQALFKVMGIADLAAWQCLQSEYYEIAPTTIKK